MKSPKRNGIGEVVTDYGAKVMKVFKEGLLGRSLFDFYGDVKALTFKTKEVNTVPKTPPDGKGGVIYTKSADGKLYYKSNEIAEVELSAADTVLTSEQVQDIVGAMFSSNTETNITVTYQDADGTIDLVATDTNTQLTTEEVQDIVGAMFTSNTETRISATYEDSDGTIDLVVDDMTADTQLTTEQVQDIVGAMFSGNTETRISATYEDGDGTIDLVVDAIPVDLTSDGAGTIHANNVPTLNQNTTGTAAGLSSTLAVSSGGTGATSLNSNSLLTGNGTSAIQAEADLTFSSGTLTLTDSNISKPIVEIKSTGGVSHIGGSLDFITDEGAAGASGDILGKIRFIGDNADQDTPQQTYALIQGKVDVATDGQESGILEFQVANHDDDLGVGLTLTGGSQNDEIDVTIGLGSSSLTTITGDLQVSGNDIKDSGGNTIISSDGSGVVTMAGGNIAVGGSNANFNMNSGSDIILEADNAGGSNTSSIQYLDSGGTNRFMLSVNNDVVRLCNRASNGKVEIVANTSSAGSGGEVTVVTVEDDKVTISQDLDVTGNVLPGITQVKIFAKDFIPDDAGRPAMIDDTGSDRWLESFSTAKLYANVEIPVGFKATHVHIYGSGTSAMTVYEADVNSKTVTSKGTGNIGTNLNITDVNSDSTNYILIELAQTSSEEVYGGIMTIAKI